MVIFHSYVKLPEGTSLELFLMVNFGQLWSTCCSVGRWEATADCCICFRGASRWMDLPFPFSKKYWLISFYGWFWVKIINLPIDTWIMLNTFYISMLLQITSHFWVNKLTWLVPFWYVLQDKSCRVFVVARLGQRSDTSLAGALRCTSAGRYSHGLEVAFFDENLLWSGHIWTDWKRQ